MNDSNLLWGVDLTLWIGVLVSDILFDQGIFFDVRSTERKYTERGLAPDLAHERAETRTRLGRTMVILCLGLLGILVTVAALLN